MEKIKDFFHDFSDVFFAIVVASIMFVVLSLNLGSWFNNSSNTVLADEPIHISQDQHNNSESKNDDIDAEDKNQEAEVEDKEVNNEEATETEATETEDAKNNNDANTNNDEVIEENKKAQEVKTIVIPNGTVGTGVAKILKDNGLIAEAKDFVQTAENLNLAGRLKSGTFEISTSATIEDMVKIIAGQK